MQGSTGDMQAFEEFNVLVKHLAVVGDYVVVAESLKNNV